MKKISHIDLGKIGEKFVADYLRDKKIRVIGSNWRCSIGEIDLVAIDRDELVFVEVKTRINSNFSRVHILDSINSRKKAKLANLAQIFLRQKKILNRKHRIDVVGVLIAPSSFQPIEFRHIVGAIEQRKYFLS